MTEELGVRSGPADPATGGVQPAGRDVPTRAAMRGAALGVALAVGVALLFLGYLRVSWTVAASSDGAAEALQARDMLAGNWLLHGWTIGDVSFYTTELPEYLLVELIRPFGVGVIHVAAAATYMLLVLAVFWLARGRAVGQEGLLRGILAAVIMLAPQLGYGAFVLLLSPDHVGTQVPLLIGWLLLDLAPRRWWVPALLCLLLAWVQFADRAALLTAVVPLIVVCAVTAIRPTLRNRPAGGELAKPPGPAGQAPAASGRYELALIGAAVISVGLSWAAARLLTAAGGFTAHALPLTLAPLSQLWTHIWLTGWGILELYGANFIGVTGRAGLTFGLLHLVGLTLAGAALAVALSRFLRPRLPRPGNHVARVYDAGPLDGAGLVDSVLAVAIVANLLSYLLSTDPGTVLGTGYEAREIAAVLPLGAVLVGRIFGPPLAERLFATRAGEAVADDRRWRVGRWGRSSPQWGVGAKTTVRSISTALLLGGLFLVIAGYGSAFGYSAAQPSAPGRYAVLADWLVAHGLRYGLSSGPAANVITVDGGERVAVEPTEVRMGQDGKAGRVEALLYQSSAAAFDPLKHGANFLVEQVPSIGAAYPAETTAPYPVVLGTFGRPARTYRFDGYTVLVWNVNLLTRLRE